MIVFIVCAVLISAPSTRVIIVCVFASDDVVAYENLMFLSLWHYWLRDGDECLDF